MSSNIQLPLSIIDIQELIPHRYPFLLVDKVTHFIDRESIVGFKNVTANEHFFVGHFPERPIMPGVLIVEALAQLGAIFAKLSSNGVPKDKLIVFAGADSIKFRRQVVPGDVLELRVKLIKQRMGILKTACVALVDGQIACEAELTAAEA